VPGGGLAPDAERWVPCKRGFFLPVRVLSRLFRRRFLEALLAAHGRGQLRFFGEQVDLSDPDRFATWLAALRQVEWVVYAKRPFAGPESVLAYLSRYTRRVAISNRRLIAHDERGVTFRWKDYRAKARTRHKTTTLSAEEFMRRFLLHVLPTGFSSVAPLRTARQPDAPKEHPAHFEFADSFASHGSITASANGDRRVACLSADTVGEMLNDAALLNELSAARKRRASGA